MAYATVADVEAVYRPLDDTETPKVERLLDYASAKIDARYLESGKSVPTEEPYLTLLKEVTCAMVVRALKDSGLGNFSSMSTTVGEFSESFSMANPDGALYLRDDELRSLGLWSGDFMSVQVGVCDDE